MNAALPVEEAYIILTDEKQNGHLVLLDTKAAFDKVIHSHLFRRMYHAGIQDKSVSHADLKTIRHASCPFYAAFRIVVQAFNNSPRFVLNSRVVHTPVHRSRSTWLLTLRTSRDMNYNQRKV
jgi:hypothetical protein